MPPETPMFSLRAALACAVLALFVACSTGVRSSGGSVDGGALDSTARANSTADASQLGADASLLAVDAAPKGPLSIAPTATTLAVTYGNTTPTVAFTATLGGSAVPASFSIDRAQIASISASSGLVTPSGKVGGVAHVTATYAGLTATTTLTVNLQLTQNGAPPGLDTDGGAGGSGGVGGAGPGGAVSAAQQTTLTSTPTADTGLSWLYPYDQTVWPQGLLAPLLQWQPGAVGNYDAVSIQLKENAFQYQGFFAANAAPFVNHPILQSAWDALSYSNQGEPVTVSLVFSSGGQAYGPITETWTIAQGVLKGTIYYGTYLSSYFQNTGGLPAQFTGGAGVLAIRPGALSPSVVIPGSESTCTVCHAVSANGSTLLVAQETFDLENMASQIAASNTSEISAYTGSPYPDGSMFMASSGQGDAPGDGYQGASLLYSNQYGAVATNGWTSAVTAAVTPSFSPNGQEIAFNFWSGAGANGVTAGGGHTLAVMDFACPSGEGGVGCGAPPYTFSNMRSIYSDPSSWPSWPSFLPDSGGVVFQSLTAPGNAPTYIFTWLGAQAQLQWSDIPPNGGTSTSAPLDALNGILNGTPYLPTSSLHPDDTTLNYEPTVNTVASGGYYWVVFTSRRLYGNVITAAPWDSPFVGSGTFGTSVDYPTPKKLWVAALDINAQPGQDRSHPAFYLPGQELNAINSRGFWVVDPCQADGASCVSGDECCGGYCVGVDGGLSCRSTTTGCSQQYDKCATSSDCCGASQGYQCIDNRCAAPAPQ